MEKEASNDFPKLAPEAPTDRQEPQTRSDDASLWSGRQDEMIDAMIRFNRVFRPRIENL